ncbi:hypothetical protein JG687_00017391, partial [Phytophthora cactorum]
MNHKDGYIQLLSAYDALNSTELRSQDILNLRPSRRRDGELAMRSKAGPNTAGLDSSM